MPLYQIDIEKSFLAATGSLIYWTNVYHADRPTLADAQSTATIILNAEKSIHYSNVTYTKYRVRPAVVGSEGSITAVNLPGARGIASNEYLPLFNVVRIDFTATIGRPSRKYLRLPVLETNQVNGALSAGEITALNTNYCTPMLGVTGLCDVDGQNFTAVTPYPYVGMRQLRRGSKRRSTPVI
jgi:hypothetical protein